MSLACVSASPRLHDLSVQPHGHTRLAAPCQKALTFSPVRSAGRGLLKPPRLFMYCLALRVCLALTPPALERSSSTCLPCAAPAARAAAAHRGHTLVEGAQRPALQEAGAGGGAPAWCQTGRGCRACCMKLISSGEMSASKSIPWTGRTTSGSLLSALAPPLHATYSS